MSDDVIDRRERVIDAIQTAFADVGREDGVTLHEADVIDDYGSAAERAAARRLDTDERWQDVPDDDIEAHGGTLSFVDAKGFRYYLRAYMVWTLRHHETSDSISSMHSIFSLTLSDEVDMRDWKLERFRAFDDRQARAICGFLRYMAAHADGGNDELASQALSAYWGRFCEG
jgi:hypothetical protein